MSEAVAVVWMTKARLRPSGEEGTSMFRCLHWTAKGRSNRSHFSFEQCLHLCDSAALCSPADRGKFAQARASRRCRTQSAGNRGRTSRGCLSKARSLTPVQLPVKVEKGLTDAGAALARDAAVVTAAGRGGGRDFCSQIPCSFPIRVHKREAQRPWQRAVTTRWKVYPFTSVPMMLA